MLLINLLNDSGLIPTPDASGAVGLVGTFVQWLILVTESLAAITIGVGVFLTLSKMTTVVLKRQDNGYERTRLTLARFLALGLEFQLAADVLSTAVAPSWTQIGKLGAIAVIRTALNYFLASEIKEEEKLTGGRGLLNLPQKPVPSESSKT